MGAPMTSRRPVVALPEPEEPDRRAVLLSMPASDRGDHLVKQLNLLYRNKLRPHELDLLRQSVIDGHLDGGVVLDEAILALSKVEGDRFIGQLRDTLKALETVVAP
jgi:hypothetical protein